MSRPDRGLDEARSPQSREWSGDVGLGVRAWVGEASPPPEPPPDPVADGPDADAESVARTILLDALTGAARSRQELRDKLAKKDVPDELAERLLDRFTEVGLVDDEAFARSWVESRQRSRGLARRALAQELRRKGVDDETAWTALDDLDPCLEERAAHDLVRKKLRSMRGVDHATATRRLAGALARKGYPAGLAFAVVRAELAEVGLDEPDPGLDVG
ncbi:MAG TPA: regulatory protein RecX [Nocardioides sp.]|nr:regulatory protein RecX [Nocardioides sp.]